MPNDCIHILTSLQHTSGVLLIRLLDPRLLQEVGDLGPVERVKINSMNH